MVMMRKTCEICMVQAVTFVSVRTNGADEAIIRDGEETFVIISLFLRRIRPKLLDASDKLARDAFVYSVKVFTSLVLFYASIISHNSGAPTEMSVGAP